jgi:hypothetical protein
MRILIILQTVVSEMTHFPEQKKALLQHGLTSRNGTFHLFLSTGIERICILLMFQTRTLDLSYIKLLGTKELMLRI